ncbi:MAG: creatininase family protein [Planctomycetes bacterium]|nr:creatininase family protein [Planctomycetota bacterium]
MTTTHDHATDKVRWEEMLPDQLLHAIQTRRVCYMAYGLAEPHGPYNALGLDFIKAQGLCELAARAHSAVVAPPFCWHIQERPSFPWMESHGVKDGGLCSSIPTDLFFRMVMFNLRAIDARGFQAAILITGHYGGVELDLRLVCDYYLRRTGSPLRIYAIADCEVIRHERYRGDHAGMTETSQLMAIRPDLVDLSRNAKGWPSGGWCGTGFPTGDGATPSRELGDTIVTSQVKQLGEEQRRLLAEYKPRPGWRAPNLHETDAIWHRFWLAASRYLICNTTLGEYSAGGPPKFPGWEALGE